MLTRTIHARAIAQSRLAPIGSMSARHLSMAARPSAVALGKRPAVARAVPLTMSMMAARHFSWSPTKPTPLGDAAAPASSAPSEAAAAASAPAPTTAAPAGVDAASGLSTPVPSSDIPSVPAEHTLPAAQHLTSTAPDHQFHSDPTALLPQPPANAMTPTLEDLVTNSGLPLEQVLNSPEAVHAAVKVSDLHLIGLDHSFINLAGWIREALVGLHELSGLPWWGTIMALTLGLRLTMVPLVIRNARHNQRLAAVSPQMQGLMKRLSEARAAGDAPGMAVAQKNLQHLFKDNDVSPFRPIIMPLIQMPFFLSMFYALRKLANLPFPQLKEGGFGWVTDLTATDPMWILPITSVCLQLLVFKVGADGTGPSAARNARTMAHVRNTMTVLSPFLVFVVGQMPAAVLFYWTTTNLFTLTQAFLLRQPLVKRLCRIPNPPQIEAPPDDAVVDTNPTLPETWKAIREFHTESFAKYRDKQMAHRASQEIEHEQARRVRPGTGLLSEHVQEARRAPVHHSQLFEDAEAQEPAPVTREAIKRRRIEAAREKRERK